MCGDCGMQEWSLGFHDLIHPDRMRWLSHYESIVRGDCRLLSENIRNLHIVSSNSEICKTDDVRARLVCPIEYGHNALPRIFAEVQDAGLAVLEKVIR